MNKTGQFWALLKFQAVLFPLPMLILFPLALGTPYYLPFILRSSSPTYHPGLDLVLSTQNLFVVAFFGLALLAPEIMRTEANRAQWPTGTEFLLTRAVDRPFVFRSRAALFYILILALPLCSLPFAVLQPALQVNEYREAARQQIVEKLAGNVAAPALKNEKSFEITIPNGSLLVESWRAWMIIGLAIAIQVSVLALYHFKYRLVILIAVYAALIGLPLFLMIKFNPTGAMPTFRETAFFFFVAHQSIVWLFTVLALFASQVWCERRFTAIEH